MDSVSKHWLSTLPVCPPSFPKEPKAHHVQTSILGAVDTQWTTQAKRLPASGTLQWREAPVSYSPAWGDAWKAQTISARAECSPESKTGDGIQSARGLGCALGQGSEPWCQPLQQVYSVPSATWATPSHNPDPWALGLTSQVTMHQPEQIWKRNAGAGDSVIVDTRTPVGALALQGLENLTEAFMSKIPFTSTCRDFKSYCKYFKGKVSIYLMLNVFQDKILIFYTYINITIFKNFKFFKNSKYFKSYFR